MKKIILITLLLVTSLCASKLEWIGNCENEIARILMEFGEYILPDSNLSDISIAKEVAHNLMIKEQQEEVMSKLENMYKILVKQGLTRNSWCEVTRVVTKQDILNEVKTKEELLQQIVGIYYGSILCYCTVGGE